MMCNVCAAASLPWFFPSSVNSMLPQPSSPTAAAAAAALRAGRALRPHDMSRALLRHSPYSYPSTGHSPPNGKLPWNARDNAA